MEPCQDVRVRDGFQGEGGVRAGGLFGATKSPLISHEITRSVIKVIVLQWGVTLKWEVMIWQRRKALGTPALDVGLNTEVFQAQLYVLPATRSMVDERQQGSLSVSNTALRYSPTVASTPDSRTPSARTILVAAASVTFVSPRSTRLT